MRKRSLIIAIIALCLTGVCFVTTALAWFALGDNVNNMHFQIAKIDSNAKLYRAVDSNFNGVPDLSEGVFHFVQLGGTSYALSADPTGVISYVGNGTLYGDSVNGVPSTVAYEVLQNVLPSQINTYKLELENQGDAPNDLRITFAIYPSSSIYYDTFNNATNINRLRAFSVAMGTGLVNGRLDGTHGESDIYNKIYFGNYITPEGTWINGVDGVDLTESIIVLLEGMLTAATNPGSNRVDIWLQFCLEPYDQLKANVLSESGSLISPQDYDALQGQNVVLPMLSIFFEVN